MKPHVVHARCLGAMLVIASALGGAGPLRSADEAAPPELLPPPAATQAARANTNRASWEPREREEVVEQLRREIEQATARNAQTITAALSAMEPALAGMHQRNMEALEKSNRTVLTAAGAFVAVALLALLGIALVLVRAIGRVSEVVAMTAQRGPTPAFGAGLPALGPVGSPGTTAAEQTSGKFLGAVDQLQTRIQELEQMLQRTVPGAVGTGALGASTSGAESGNIRSLPANVAVSASRSGALDPASEVAMLIGKGQALMNLDEVEEALNCFDRALALAPDNADALVKRGLALEKLQNWELAAETYSRAIALDDTLTVAYLYKGGVCNRLQRYREAIDCYEEALRAEKRRRAS
ncbi:MAG TPA: tetratricopeptide repeat protein [Methylomirabilota bacterium]|nr:tetratricopeptide repeat protein [Methylomirabilota bacterium]